MSMQMGTHLPQLAERINHEHEQAEAAARSAIDHALQCGRLLIEAKAKLQHGQWLPWLERNCTVGIRQAQRYIKLALGWEQIEAKNDTGSHLSVTDALRLLESPTEYEAKATVRREPTLQDVPKKVRLGKLELQIEWGIERMIRGYDSAVEMARMYVSQCGYDDGLKAFAERWQLDFHAEKGLQQMCAEMMAFESPNEVERMRGSE